MLQPILKLGDSLTIVLLNIRSNNVPLTRDEKTVVQDCMKTLEIFNYATELISGDKCVTVSLIIPLVMGLF
jgi:hypothetical protein